MLYISDDVSKGETMQYPDYSRPVSSEHLRPAEVYLVQTEVREQEPEPHGVCLTLEGAVALAVDNNARVTSVPDARKDVWHWGVWGDDLHTTVCIYKLRLLP